MLDKCKAAIFVIIEVILLFLLLFLPKDNRLVCYISIVLCLVFALTNINKSADGIFLCLGLLFTVISDTFLVLLRGSNTAVAMSTFLTAQICYFLKIQITGKSWISYALQAAVTATACSLFLVYAFKVLPDVSITVIISLIYFSFLLSNFTFSALYFRRNGIFALGLFLFLLCDLTIGFDFLTAYLHLTDGFIYDVAGVPFNLTWLTYLPSQILIALSGQKGLFSALPTAPRSRKKDRDELSRS